MTSDRTLFQKCRPWIVLVGALVILAILFRFGFHFRNHGSHHHY